MWLNFHTCQHLVNGADGNRTGEHEIMRRTLYEHGYEQMDTTRFEFQGINKKGRRTTYKLRY